jgi:hypothetical protein
MLAGGIFGPGGADRPSPGLSESGEIIGVLDGLRADFALAPLPGEASCQEDLHPFNPEAQLKGRRLPLSAFAAPSLNLPGRCG